MLKLTEGGVLGLERGGEGGRELRTCSQRWLRERHRDPSDDSSPFFWLVYNGGEDEFTGFFPGLRLTRGRVFPGGYRLWMLVPVVLTAT